MVVCSISNAVIPSLSTRPQRQELVVALIIDISERTPW
jgi:hypothetical protein